VLLFWYWWKHSTFRHLNWLFLSYKFNFFPASLHFFETIHLFKSFSMFNLYWTPRDITFFYNLKNFHSVHHEYWSNSIHSKQHGPISQEKYIAGGYKNWNTIRSNFYTTSNTSFLESSARIVFPRKMKTWPGEGKNVASRGLIGSRLCATLYQPSAERKGATRLVTETITLCTRH